MLLPKPLPQPIRVAHELVVGILGFAALAVENEARKSV